MALSESEKRKESKKECEKERKKEREKQRKGDKSRGKVINENSQDRKLSRKNRGKKIFFYFFNEISWRRKINFTRKKEITKDRQAGNNEN